MVINVKLRLLAALLLACTVPARGFAQLPPKAGELVNLAIPSFNVTALPVYAAVDKGFFVAEGIDLRVIKVQGSHTVATLITGDI
jgi:ABC-type nitrate/sulfonate/bicarbonate transport system substrate-binding protein